MVLPRKMEQSNKHGGAQFFGLYMWSLDSFIKLQQHLALLELFPCLMLKPTTANIHANNPVEKKRLT